MRLRKFIKTALRECLDEQQILKESNSLNDIDMSKLLNKFIQDPIEFVRIFNINPKHSTLPPEMTLKLSLFSAKFKIDVSLNWFEIHKNLTAVVDGMDVSQHVKDLIYPSDVPKLINDTDNFLKKLERRVRQRKNTASKEEDFSNPYGIAHLRITPINVVNDVLNNPDTKFNYTQYEYAKADLDLQLIKLLKSGELDLKTSRIEEVNHDMLDVLWNGVKGEELINLVPFKSLKKYIEKLWRHNKKNIENKYIEAKNNGANPVLVRTIEELKN
jgi:hypothetical protein